MDRIYHPWHSWECYKEGFFNTAPPEGLTKEEALNAFSEFLKDLDAFDAGIRYVFKNWTSSCEHNLTNDTMNKIAWIGQAAACAMVGIPANFRQGYNLLTEKQQKKANELAELRIKEWVFCHNQIKLDI